MKKRQPGTLEFPFSQRDFRFIAEFIHNQTGIHLPSYKYNMVYSRLVRRLRALGLSNFKEYCSLLKENDVETIHCINALTTNLTAFFREPHHFEHLHDSITHMLASDNPQKKLRLWSAACSSGQEAYSMAMTIYSAMEVFPHAHWDVKILATDIDTGMLETAMHGEYPERELPVIPLQYRRFLHHSDHAIQIAPEIRRMVTFKPLNLLDSWPMKGQFDAVFCRNVVIYFTKETQKRLFTRLHSILKPEGELYIGHSENLFSFSHSFTSVGRTIYRRTP